MWTLKLSIAYLLAASAVGTISFVGCTTPGPAASDDDEPGDDAKASDAGKKADAGKTSDAGKSADAGKKSDAGFDIDIAGDAGPVVEACPTGLECGALALPVQAPGVPAALCLEGATPPQCPDSKDCSEIDLPGAQCVSVDFSGVKFSFCVQECVAGGGREVDAGKDAGKADAGKASDAGKADAGKDAGRG